MAEPRTTAPGPSDIAEWQKQIVTPGATVSGNTPTNADPIAVELFNMSIEQRKQLALLLKNAGYNVPTSGSFSDKLLNAYTNAVASAQTQAMRLGQPFNSDFFKSYIAREMPDSGAAAGGAGGPSVTEYPSTITDSDAKSIIDAIIRGQNQRAATPAEIAKYTKIIQQKAAAQPSVTKVAKVGGKTVVKTTPGFGTQEAKSYLLDQIAGTDEAKANQVLGYYETFMKALGG